MNASDSQDVCVVGAGVAGLATAVQLQRDGRRVLVIDRSPPGSETSAGNAGLLSPDTAIPIALPGMLRRIPRMLADRRGPLTLRWSGVPRLTPWMVRWTLAARPASVDRVSDAMRALHRDALGGWRELLGADRFGALVRTHGQLRVWYGDAGLSAEESRLYERHRIDVEAVSGARLRSLAPGLDEAFRNGLLVRGNGHTVDPRGLVEALAERLVHEGGRVRREGVLALRPTARGNGWNVITTSGEVAAGTVVVAAGIASRGLLRPLGVRLPLEAERGYNATIPGEHLTLAQPVVFGQDGFVVTPMREGTRAAGTVELGAHPGAPDMRRAERLLASTRRAFPELRAAGATLWSGDRPSTPDGLPLLGAVRGWPGLFLCTGHGHFGLTAAPRSAHILARAMSPGQVPAPDDSAYSLERFRLSTGGPTPDSSVVNGPVVKELP